MCDLPDHIFYPLVIFSYVASMGATFWLITWFTGMEFRRNGFKGFKAHVADEASHQSKMDELFQPLCMNCRAELGARFQ